MKTYGRAWLDQLRQAPAKKALPIISFPAIQLMGISVRELISSSDAQAKGMKLVADRLDSAASVSLMDLSVEAECFGSQIRVSDDEVPTGCRQRGFQRGGSQGAGGACGGCGTDRTLCGSH